MGEFQATVLSPVHIGTGKYLSPSEDYVVSSGTISRYRIDAVVAGLIAAEVAQDTVASACRQGISGLVKLGQQEEVEFGSSRLYSSACYGNPRQISELFHSGKSQSPMVPGTSIKGAVEKALVWWMLKSNPDLLAEIESRLLQQGRPRRLEFADSCTDGLLIGKDPNHQIGRLFSFGDSSELGWDVVEVSSVIVEVPRQGARLEHKILPRGSTNRLEESTFIYVEALKAGTEFNGHFSIDQRLLGERSLGWRPYQIEAIVNLVKACQEQAASIIQSRLAFWSIYQNAVLVEFYKKLVELATKADGFVLPVGWGTGFQTKTIVDLFSAETQSRFREFYGQRSGDRVHITCGSIVSVDSSDSHKWYCPKCRQGGLQTDKDVWAPAKSHKVVVNQNGEITGELGWVWIQVEMPEIKIAVQPTPVRPAEPQRPQPPQVPTGQRQTGVVKMWNDEKGFGFITPDKGGKDVFMHYTAFERGIVPKPGQKVEFDIVQGEKGFQARNVRFIN